MAFVAILGRRLDRPMLNFGFSGNGKMEAEVARFLAELDPPSFVLDCLANMAAVPVTPSTIEVVSSCARSAPDTPILFWMNAAGPTRWIFRSTNRTMRSAAATSALPTTSSPPTA